MENDFSTEQLKILSGALQDLDNELLNAKKQVVTELERFILRNSELKDCEEDSPSVIEIEILQQKLKELKGEKLI